MSLGLIQTDDSDSASFTQQVLVSVFSVSNFLKRLLLAITNFKLVNKMLTTAGLLDLDSLKVVCICSQGVSGIDKVWLCY